MALLTQLEWDRFIELVEFDFTRHGQGIRRFCNSALGWAEVLDEEGGAVIAEEPTEMLDEEFITHGDEDYLCLPFKSKGWRTGGDGVERPAIEIGDVGGVMLSLLRSMGGAKLCPVRHMKVLAEDVIAGTGDIIGVPMDYMIHKVRGNGMVTTIELGTYADTTRTKFPPSIMRERDFPGLRQKYQRN